MRAVTFDLWGTLFSDDPPKNASAIKKRRELAQTILASCGLHFSYEEIEGAFSSFAKEIGMIRTKGFDIDTTEQTVLLLSQLHITPQKKLTDEIEETLSSLWLSTLPSLAPHAEEALSFLSPRTKIGLISNTGWTSGKNIRLIFDKMGILHRFTYLTFSNEVGFWKPNPATFQYAARGLEESPKRMMHVGDSLTADIRGARSVGMRTVQIGDSEEADFRIRDLGEIMDIWEKANTYE
jgi:HAD superfamily hydrolase (TIGR01549 family)